MKPVYHWIDHTGELELEIRSETETGVFEDALAALAEVLGAPSSGGDVSHEIALEGTDRAALLADYLMELLFLAETTGFVPGRLELLTLDDHRLHARVHGAVDDPSSLVKAVTYHGLTFEPADEGWRAHVVLDV